MVNVILWGKRRRTLEIEKVLDAKMGGDLNNGKTTRRSESPCGRVDSESNLRFKYKIWDD